MMEVRRVKFDWNMAFHAVMSILAIIGIPGLIVASIWCFMDEHPFIGGFLSILTLAFIGFLCGLPGEVIS